MQAKYLPKNNVAARYGVTTRTVDRWEREPKLGFPASVGINGRRYFRDDELDAFDRDCVRRATRPQPAYAENLAAAHKGRARRSSTGKTERPAELARTEKAAG
jgi:hypothetical protein